jgi:hypothetical protein
MVVTKYSHPLALDGVYDIAINKEEFERAFNALLELC